MADLFTPVQLGALTLANRVLMAPLTRTRADADHVPTDLMVEHYAQRASAGLIIAEATMAMEGNSAFWREPGIYSEAQVSGWKRVTDAVHAKGGKIFLQIWHGGRACHPLLNGGRVPVAPSAMAITNDEVHTPEGKKAYTVPVNWLMKRFRPLSKGLKSQRKMPRELASTVLKYTARMVIYWMSSCVMAPTTVKALMVARSKTVLACC